MKITKPYNSTQKLSSSLLGIEEASTQTSTIILDKEEELCIIEVISDSRFPVLLVYSALEKSYSIMKCFPFEANKISLYYKNESRFAGIQHPNIISVKKTVDKKLITSQNSTIQTSYVLLELCLCDFHDLVLIEDLARDKKLVRTFFHQLIAGIEYLHSSGISHMDLKLENLLLGKDYKLKITDFDLSYMKSDIIVAGNGTKHYRAPELKERCCKQTEPTDIYSAGIILFTLWTGSMPYLEDEFIHGENLYDTLINHPQYYWGALNRIDHCWRHLEENFKELFLSMVKKDPKERASITQIKESKWFNGPTYTQEELKAVLDKLLEGTILN